MTKSVRVPLLERDALRRGELADVLERAEKLSVPRPEWYQFVAHSPEMAIGYDRFWNLTYRGGAIDLNTKELVRLTITTLFECAFCSTQRSTETLEQGLDEEEIAACALPNYDAGDERTAVALEYARALVGDVVGGYDDWDRMYAKLLDQFSAAEVAELVCLCANIIGGTLVARTLNLPTGQTVSGLT